MIIFFTHESLVEIRFQLLYQIPFRSFLILLNFFYYLLMGSCGGPITYVAAFLVTERS